MLKTAIYFKNKNRSFSENIPSSVQISMLKSATYIQKNKTR